MPADSAKEKAAEDRRDGNQKRRPKQTVPKAPCRLQPFLTSRRALPGFPHPHPPARGQDRHPEDQVSDNRWRHRPAKDKTDAQKAPEKGRAPSQRVPFVQHDSQGCRQQEGARQDVERIQVDQAHAFSGFAPSAARRASRAIRRSRAWVRHAIKAKAAMAVGIPQSAIAQELTSIFRPSKKAFMSRIEPTAMKMSSPKKFPTFSAAAACARIRSTIAFDRFPWHACAAPSASGASSGRTAPACPPMLIPRAIET